MSVHLHGIPSCHPFSMRWRAHARVLNSSREPPQSPPMLHPKSFPTELLLIIFSFVFDDLATYCTESHEAHKECAVCNSPDYTGQKHVIWEWQDDVSSSALFPYSLATVCRRWRDIMASVPQFWTRPIIFLDGPLLDFRSHLKWSGKLPIEVFVLRRRHSTSLGIDESEQARSRRVFEAIKPHLHRCHILRLSLLQSTSLPSLVFDFLGVDAPLLTDLRLECEIDDQRDYPNVRVPLPLLNRSMTIPIPHPVIQYCRCPSLTALSLNGRNFRDLSLAIRHGYKHWLPVLQNIEKFTVAHYSSGLPQEYAFSLSDLLQVIRWEHMSRLTFLKLIDLDIKPAGGSEDSVAAAAAATFPLPIVEITALHIHLEELDSEVIRQLSASINVIYDLESFHVIRSPIPETWNIPDTCDLILEEVNDLCGMNSPIREWIGNRLMFTGCNGFNDDFLKMLRSSSGGVTLPLMMQSLSDGVCGSGGGDAMTSEEEGPGVVTLHQQHQQQASVVPFTFNCSNLQEIYLDDCMNYSIGALKMVVATRNAGLVPFGRKAMESDGPPCILELYVTGIGPVLSAEDKVWFEQRLPLFYWDTRRRGTGSHD